MGFGARWVTVPGRDEARRLLHRALELGVDFIDTADVYGGVNASEQMIAEALHPYPANLVIATKGGQTSVDGQPVPDCRPEYLKEACERSLRALRVDTIDLYQLHNPDPDVPIEESLGALVELREAGKIRHIGVSNVSANCSSRRSRPRRSSPSRTSTASRAASRIPRSTHARAVTSPSCPGRRS